MGYEVKHLPYFKAGAFDFESYMAGLRSAGPGSAIVLHACAHNPTGCDPSHDQWREIAELVRGPGAVMVMGRIVNFSEVLGKSGSQPKARGWHCMLVRDDGGVLQVSGFVSALGVRRSCVGICTSYLPCPSPALI